MNSIEAYPLSWPQGTPRAIQQRKSAFKTTSIGAARDKLISEIRMLGGSDLVISTNLKLRKDGLPISDQSQPLDRGVAIYFKWRKAPRSIACDKWNRIEDNIHALALSVSAMRGLERWGATDILQKVFQGFTALPAPKGSQWWEVINVTRASDLDFIEDRYRSLAKRAHPDNGGSVEKMTALNRAIEEARLEKR